MKCERCGGDKDVHDRVRVVIETHGRTLSSWHVGVVCYLCREYIGGGIVDLLDDPANRPGVKEEPSDLEKRLITARRQLMDAIVACTHDSNDATRGRRDDAADKVVGLEHQVAKSKQEPSDAVD